MNTKYVLRDAHSGRYWGLVSHNELGWLESSKKALTFTLKEAKEYANNNRLVVDYIPVK